jgi:hypothetical protein
LDHRRKYRRDSTLEDADFKEATGQRSKNDNALMTGCSPHQGTELTDVWVPVPVRASDEGLAVFWLLIGLSPYTCRAFFLHSSDHFSDIPQKPSGGRKSVTH